MKSIKKIFALLLACVMVMGLNVTAFAASDGSITITNPTEGQTYTAYKIFDLTYATDEDGKVTGYAYTATNDQKTFYESQDGNPFVFTENTTGTYNVSIGTKTVEGETVSYTDAEVIAFLQSFISTDTDGNVTVNSEFAKVIGTGVVGTTGTDTEGNAIVTISGLDYGYYLVTSALGTVVTIDSTTPNVTVTDKNGQPTVDKDVKEDSKTEDAWGDSNTAGIGDTVDFRTEVTIPVGSVNVTVHDDMSEGLTLGTTIKVYTDADLTTELAAGNYTVTTSDLTDGCEFEVSFTASYLNSLTAETKVYVSYSATVNNKAVISSDGNPNKATVSYGNGSSVTSTPSETKTYVWTFDLHKYESSNENGYLADAEFVLSYGSGESTKYATFSTSEDGLTYLLTGWVDSKESATHIKTLSTGKITINGLDADTYQLTEVAAPAGYNLLDAPVTVVIAETGTVTVGTDTTAVDEVKVLNQSGTELPQTGGIGTTIFYVVGTILVLGAAILLITKKRMSNVQ